MALIKNVKVIDTADWDQLVMDTYGRPYAFQQQDGCKERGTVTLRVPCAVAEHYPDEIPEVINGPVMGVSFAAWLARPANQPIASENEYLSMWWERNFYPDIQMIANDLHAKGLLPADQYMINIDW